MRTTTVRPTTGPTPGNALDGWPSGCVESPEGLRISGNSLEHLVETWGSPLWVLDEAAYIGAVLLLRQAGAHHVVGGDPWALQTARWARRYRWAVWGGPRDLEHAWFAETDSRRQVLDLRHEPAAASATRRGGYVLVDDASPRHGRQALVFVDVEPRPGAEARTPARPRGGGPVHGLAVRLAHDESPTDLERRLTAALGARRQALVTAPTLFIDGREHGDPLPLVRAAAAVMTTTAGHAPHVLADVAGWMRAQSTLIVAEVRSVRRTPAGPLLRLSAAPSASTSWIPGPVLAHHATRAGSQPLREVDESQGSFEVAFDALVGEVVALAGVRVAPGLCLVVQSDGTAHPVPRLDAG